MQKKLIALAVASLATGAAFAQSNVTISGMAAVSYTNSKVSDSTRPVATENRLDDQTSRFTIKGTEDLGGGLSAYFQIENRVSLDTRPNQAFGNSQGLADGESFVGIKHANLGSVGFGKFAQHYHETLGYSESYRALNTQNYSVGLMGTVGGSFVAFSSRANNTIKYDTPNWSGFSAKVSYSFNPACNEGTLGQGANCTTTYTGNTLIPSTAIGATGTVTLTPQTTTAARGALNSNYNKGGAWNLAGRYNNGPINAYASYYDYKVEGGNATAASLGSFSITSAGVVTATLPGATAATNPNRGGQKSWKIGGDYSFPFGLKAGLHYDNSKLIGATSATDTKRSAWMIPLSYSFGANAVYLTYIKANDLSVNGAKVNQTGAKQWILAYDYALSKRTFVGASYMNLNNERLATYTPWLAGISTLGSSNTTAGENDRQISLNLTHVF